MYQQSMTHSVIYMISDSSKIKLGHYSKLSCYHSWLE